MLWSVRSVCPWLPIFAEYFIQTAFNFLFPFLLFLGGEYRRKTFQHNGFPPKRDGLGPRLSACDELPQRQVQAIQTSDNSTQQRHDDRGLSQEEGEQGKQEQQGSHKETVNKTTNGAVISFKISLIGSTPFYHLSTYILP